jgi:hypothetical protein
MPPSQNTKYLGRKNVPRRNVSKSISRTKKPSADLVAFLDWANSLPDEATVAELKEKHTREKQDLDQRLEEAGESAKQTLRAEILRQEKERDFEMRKTLLMWGNRIHVQVVVSLAKTDEIQYLRTCGSCQSFFFAGRKDQQGCSPSCLNKIRKQRWRKNYAQAKAGEKRGYLKETRASKRR